MVLYAKVGKFRHRDRMLTSLGWRGDERVLDVGTGRGLLLVGAARRLKTGHAVGLDIWRAKDLSDNSRERTEQNVKVEGVEDRCELVEAPAQTMPFPDAAFDVVVSNLCLHNISKRADRDAACGEIARVLKPGGTALISDFIRTGEYARGVPRQRFDGDANRTAHVAHVSAAADCSRREEGRGRMKRIRRSAALVAVTLASLISFGREVRLTAWGAQGHHVVARIAWGAPHTEGSVLPPKRFLGQGHRGLRVSRNLGG